MTKEENQNKTFKNLNDLEKQNYILKIKDEKEKTKLTKYIDNDDIKGEILKTIKDDKLKKEILESFKDDNKKLKYAYEFDDQYYFTEAIKKSENEAIKIKAIEKGYCKGYTHILISTLKDDKQKIKYINWIKEAYFTYVLKTIKDNESLKQLYYNKEYSKYKGLILSLITDKDFVKKEFNEAIKNKTNDVFFLLLIDNTKDKELKRYMLKNYNSKKYKLALISNEENLKEELLKDININYQKDLIDQDITIGIELEAVKKEDNPLKNLKKLLKTWIIKQDDSIKEGIEIASPILRYTEKDFKELKFICEYLKSLNYTTTINCGGHIHIGGDYLKEEKELEMLYYIYLNCEEIFKKISNRKSTKPRQNTFSFAAPLAPKIKETIKRNENIEIENIKTFISFIVDTQISRNYSINLRNMYNSKQTIEFRVPNGEIEYNELFYNILLYTTLVQRSKQLAHTYNEKIEDLSNKKIREKEKVKILLDILFQDNQIKAIYQERFNENTNILYKLSKNDTTIYFQNNKDKKIR